MKIVHENIKENISVIEQHQPTELKKIGSIILQRGQKLWQCDLKDGEIKECEMEAIFINGKKKAIIKKGFLYDVAINKKNAQRKFLKKLQNYINETSNRTGRDR
jgi:hypothetical protein